MTTQLYLAYGSNLSRRAMRQRCPTARPVGKYLLNNARLVFRGVADVIYEQGAQCPVGVWTVKPRDVMALDRYEGVGSGFYSKYDVKLDEERSAFIYLMNRDGIYPPSEYYYHVLQEGYRDFGIPESYLKEALTHAFEFRAETQHTRQRRARQIASGHQAKLAPRPDVAKQVKFIEDEANAIAADRAANLKE